MGQEDTSVSGGPTGIPYATLFKLALLAGALGIGHHIDHILRGNHVGWPLIPEVTPFTYSLVIYPFIVIGLYLHVRGRVGPGYWTVLATVGVVFVGLVHFGPLAVEVPGDVVDPYRSAVAGYAALAWLITFLVVLIGTAVYAGRLWLRERGHRVTS